MCSLRGVLTLGSLLQSPQLPFLDESESRSGIFLGDSVDPEPEVGIPLPDSALPSSPSTSLLRPAQVVVGAGGHSLSAPSPGRPAGPQKQAGFPQHPHVCPSLPHTIVCFLPPRCPSPPALRICAGLRAESADFQLISPPTSDCTSNPGACR